VTLCFSRSVELHEKVIGAFIEKDRFYSLDALPLSNYILSAAHPLGDVYKTPYFFYLSNSFDAQKREITHHFPVHWLLILRLIH
jgi:hypothetical protein